MIDRCAGCGWPLQGNLACCFGAGYWSQRTPLPEDEAAIGTPLRAGDWYLYSAPSNPSIAWSPAFPKPTGHHPGHPPFVLHVYLAYLEKATKQPGGVRSLLHHEDILRTIDWASLEMAKREHREGH